MRRESMVQILGALIAAGTVLVTVFAFIHIFAA